MRWLIGFLALLIVLFLIGYFQIDGGVMMPGQNVLDSALQWVTHAVGSAVAGLAAILLLVRAFQGQSAESVVFLVPALFAGLLLLHPDWTTAVALAAVAISLILRDVFGGRPPRESQDPF